jgi:hypothetical protein
MPKFSKLPLLSTPLKRFEQWANSAHQLGMCTNVDNRFNALAYLDILENIMLLLVRAVFPENNFVSQHDICRVHTARIATTT